MADIVIVTIIIAFTALCVAYISWCDRIIGPDELLVEAATESRIVADRASADPGVAAVTS